MITDKDPVRRDGYRYRICSDCKRTYNVPIDDPNVKKYICPNCEYKKNRPGTAIPKAAERNSLALL